MHLADVHAASEPTAMSYLVASSEADAAHAHVQSVLTSWPAFCARAPTIANAKRATRDGGSDATAASGAAQRIVPFLFRRTAERWSAVELARIGSYDSVRTRA